MKLDVHGIGNGHGIGDGHGIGNGHLVVNSHGIGNNLNGFLLIMYALQ